MQGINCICAACSVSELTIEGLGWFYDLSRRHLVSLFGQLYVFVLGVTGHNHIPTYTALLQVCLGLDDSVVANHGVLNLGT